MFGSGAEPNNVGTCCKPRDIITTALQKPARAKIPALTKLTMTTIGTKMMIVTNMANIPPILEFLVCTTEISKTEWDSQKTR